MFILQHIFGYREPLLDKTFAIDQRQNLSQRR